MQVQQSSLDLLCSLKTIHECIKDGVNSRCYCVELDHIMTTHATETLLIVQVGIAWYMGTCCLHHSHQLGLGTV